MRLESSYRQEGNLVDISEPQVSHLEQNDPQIQFSIGVVNFHKKNLFPLKPE